jgi:hypothetical protein
LILLREYFSNNELLYSPLTLLLEAATLTSGDDDKDDDDDEENDDDVEILSSLLLLLPSRTEASRLTLNRGEVLLAAASVGSANRSGGMVGANREAAADVAEEKKPLGLLLLMSITSLLLTNSSVGMAVVSA